LLAEVNHKLKRNQETIESARLLAENGAWKENSAVNAAARKNVAATWVDWTGE